LIEINPAVKGDEEPRRRSQLLRPDGYPAVSTSPERAIGMQRWGEEETLFPLPDPEVTSYF
jgi:hypothetical protein